MPRNFGQFNSPYYGMLQVTGDCVIEMVADFQDPVEMIPKYVHEWEKGYKIVIGIKTSSKENKCDVLAAEAAIIRPSKSCQMWSRSSILQAPAFMTGNLLRSCGNLDDPTPFLRGIVAELGYKRKEIPYEQPKRRAGKTHNNFYRLYDAAMLSVTSYTKAGTSSGHHFRQHLRSSKHDHCTGLSGNEADLVGPFPGRYGAHADWNAVFGLCTAIFHWFSG